MPNSTAPHAAAGFDPGRAVDRAAALIAELGLQPHPEGGHYREFHRTPAGPGQRAALTSIDFLLVGGDAPQFSAWHRVDADEVWHLLEGDGLDLWLMPPGLTRLEQLTLGPVAGMRPAGATDKGHPGAAARRPRHVVPAGWWQAARPIGAYAYVGATVAPGFEFSGFSFGRDDPGLVESLRREHPALARLL